MGPEETMHNEVGPSRWQWIAMLLALTALAVTAPAAYAAGPGETEASEGIRMPTEAEIRAEYQRDRSNQKFQTWTEYKGWVESFFQGNFLADGWTKYGQTTLDSVKLNDARRTLVKKINHLGKLIGREWAKHESVRKITSDDLRRWHNQITAARRADDGSGQNIQNAVDRVRTQAERQLKG
jgi:hypothetical protein